MTYGEIIDRVLANVGDSRAGTDTSRTRILDDIKDLMEVDIPAAASGPFSEGQFTMQLGGIVAGSNNAGGVYDIPSEVRAVHGPLYIDGDEIWENAVYTDPRKFWNDYKIVTAEANVGKPTAVLIHGLSFTFRPIPEVSASAPIYSLIGYGELYPAVGITENAEVPRRVFEGLLISGATMLHAARESNADAVQTHTTLFQSRLNSLRMSRSIWTEKPPDRPRYL